MSLVDAIPNKWKTLLKIASSNKSYKSMESDNVKKSIILKNYRTHTSTQ